MVKGTVDEEALFEVLVMTMTLKDGLISWVWRLKSLLSSWWYLAVEEDVLTEEKGTDLVDLDT
jgi:hypothetical protein